MIIRSMLAAAVGLAAFGVGAAPAQDYPTNRSPSSSALRPAASPTSAPASRRLHHARDRPAGRGREPHRRRRHRRHERRRKSRARRLHARPRAVREFGDQSVRAEADAVRRAQGSSPGGGARRGPAADRDQRRGPGARRSRNSSRSPRRNPQRCTTARPVPARCRISPRRISRTWPASSSCTCPIAATRRRPPT